MQENKAIRKFRRSNFLANKLDCYTFYNEIYKMLDEEDQVRLDSSLWFTLESMKIYGYVTLEEFAKYFYKVLKNKMPDIEFKEMFNASYHLLKEYYNNLEFYNKLNASKINYQTENTKGELFLLYINLYKDIANRLGSYGIINYTEILETVDEVLANSIDVNDKIDYVNYKLLDTAIKYSIRDRLLKEDLILNSGKEENYLIKYSLVTEIVGINKNNREIAEICKKENMSLWDYTKSKISIAIRKRNR